MQLTALHVALMAHMHGRQTQMQVTVEKCQEKVDTLKKQRADIDSSIKELTGFIKTVQAAMADAKAQQS